MYDKITKITDVRAAAKKASEALFKGQIIATPTDTVYGLAALVQNRAAVRALYDLKGRNGQKPIAVCVGEIEDVYSWCRVTVSRELLTRLLPGPVTLVFKRSEALNPEFNPSTDLVGIRIPDHDFVRRICRNLPNQPVALTSANKSSAGSSLTVDDFKDLLPGIGAVFREQCEPEDRDRSGSTIIDLSGPGNFEIIRDGCALEATVGILKAYNLVKRGEEHLKDIEL